MSSLPDSYQKEVTKPGRLMTTDLRAFANRNEKERKTKNHNILSDAVSTVACRLVGCGFLNVESIVLLDSTLK